MSVEEEKTQSCLTFHELEALCHSLLTPTHKKTKFSTQKEVKVQIY